jgi:SET domain-containing protein
VRVHAFLRELHKRKKDNPFLPDADNFTRLQPSPIHGVGVFAIRDIPKDKNIFKDDHSEIVWIDRKDVLMKSGEIRRLYDDFCVLNGDKYGCPDGFNNLTPAWYINEPPKGQEPNVVCGDDYDFFAARNIRAGEELTVKYGTYSDDPESDTALSEAPRNKKE